MDYYDSWASGNWNPGDGTVGYPNRNPDISTWSYATISGASSGGTTYAHRVTLTYNAMTTYQTPDGQTIYRFTFILDKNSATPPSGITINQSKEFHYN